MFKKILLPLGAGIVIGGMAIKKMCKKNLFIGEKAPSFSAVTTIGKINFPYDYNGKWIVFFSYPADFSPVCTTELKAFQAELSSFKKINTELIGISTDDILTHKNWLKDISKSTNNEQINNKSIEIPIIDDKTTKISQLYNMLQFKKGNPTTERVVYIIDDKGVIRSVLYYPQSIGRNIEEIKRIVTALKVTDEFDVATPANWEPGKDVFDTLPDIKPQNTEIMENNWYLCLKNLSKDSINNKIIID